MKICFCTPYGPDFSDPEVKRAMYGLQLAMMQHTFTYAEITMNVVSLARNSLVESVPQEVDVTFWVDSDVVIPPEATLLFDYLTDETPVVSGIYVSRRFPHFPQVYTKATNHTGGSHPYLPVVDPPQEPTYYDAVGAGFMLVKRWVFDELAARQGVSHDRLRKWIKRYRGKKDTIQWMEIEKALHTYMSLKPWFEFLGRVGEDFYFCEQLATIGIRPLVVPVWAHHIGLERFGIEHFNAVKTSNLQYISDAANRGAK